ncbi:MAG: tRNA (adenosine(37)-N6)-dimethylallyltransferase MiaA [Ardenticatenaceae bacterium]|nr:tRNA (adenosine(37)-N6)-dimethylallyltransferase MiaA [Ardenticatenaceae bacterium]MCB9446063.1 tRNA (adenosine(37)-N6)-dimethylallyltransferase MiaA [Ardenticatenaceae bacterium]
MKAERPLLVIVGATAVGKTDLSLQLARQFDGEIVSADSRLFYRGMDIGTAKPSAAEQASVPHHLIDICDPDETLTLAEYQRLAYAAIERIQGNGRLPIVVGGTGQYVRAVVEGWGIPEVAPHPALREALAALGGDELARWLRHLDPAAAEKLDPRNVRRVIRALEVTLLRGRPISELQRKNPPPYRIAQIGLHRDRASLYQRIDERVGLMMVNGLLAEVEKLRDEGYGRQLPSMSGLGYRQLWAYLAGEMSLADAVERIKFETHRFARQQATWFRQDDPAINWFEPGEAGEKETASPEQVEEAAILFVRQWLAKS